MHIFSGRSVQTVLGKIWQDLAQNSCLCDIHLSVLFDGNSGRRKDIKRSADTWEFFRSGGTLHGSFIVGSVFCIAAFVIGFLINGNRHDAGTTKILIKIIMIFTIGFLMSHYLNCMIDRQSYSVLVNGGNIDGFMPWYRLPNDSKLLMSFTDLITSHQGSFVSSHALYAVLFIIIFPSYSLAVPALKKHEKLLMAIAGIVSVTVILCRILSGNNYLTDISFGALYSLKFSMSYNGINKTRKHGKPAQIFRK